MLPLVDDVEADAWKERQSDMKAYFAPIVDDTSCFTLSQGQIMPCYPIGGRSNAFCKRVHGVFFDLDVIPRVIKRNLVIDSYKTYTTHNYTEDTVLDFARMVARNAMGQFNRNETFRYACWLVANGIYDLDLVRQVSSFDAATTPEQHMKDAAMKFHQYNGNNYHMGWYKKYQDPDFWILHA
ncbi:TPA: hypothetical protein MB808_005852, partial [Klebsiella quasipneumoniae]|nr:hypothetical protein [Klebsiella quasipneumoniae]